MGILRFLTALIKGLFGFLGNPQRLEIKKQKEERKDTEHEERTSVREKQAVLDELKKDNEIDQQKHKNEKKAKNRDDKVTFGRFFRIKRKRANNH